MQDAKIGICWQEWLYRREFIREGRRRLRCPVQRRSCQGSSRSRSLLLLAHLKIGNPLAQGKKR
jgi:hypothetical protein